ncbi:MAG: EAL domain-containing protein [Hyphomicrobiales bacterium]
MKPPRDDEIEGSFGRALRAVRGLAGSFSLGSLSIVGLSIVVAGLLITALLVGGGQWLLLRNARTNAQATLDNISHRMIGTAEQAFDEALTAMTGLAVQGVSRCTDASIDHLRRAVYATYAVKEIGLTEADGSTYCNHLGIAPPHMHAVSDAFEGRNPTIHFRAAETEDGATTGTMISWDQGDKTVLVAIILGRALTADLLPEEWRASGAAVIRLDDGTLLSSSQRGDEAGLDKTPAVRSDIVEAHLHSERYPIHVTVAVPFEAVWAEYASLHSYTQFGGFLLAFFVVTIAFFMSRNSTDGPINEIERAIRNDEFLPYYQPVVDIRTGRLEGCEALIRWKKPDGTVLSPGAFIGLAEATGLAVPMTRLLMEKVRSDLEQIYHERPHLKVSINLFRDHFDSIDITEDVERIFGKSKIRYRQLVFEVTEREPLADLDTAKLVIRRLQSFGARVALDDAGTGHSGLAYLQELAMDVLKIDKLFVDAIGTNRFAAPIIHSLVGIARNCQMSVIAEGVETLEQIEYLKALGISAAQGYVFAPPLPAAAFLKLATAMEPLKYQSLVEPPDIDFIDAPLPDLGSRTRRAA